MVRRTLRIERSSRAQLPLTVAIISILINTLLWGVVAQAQPGQTIGQVTALEGNATVQRNVPPGSDSLSMHSSVYLGDTIRTEAASKVTLTFVDASTVTLGEKSTLEITQFVYSPQRQTWTVLLTIPIGIFRAIVKQLLPQSTFEVNTPTAIAAIRGTDFMGEVTAEATAIVVLTGTVVISNLRPRFRGMVILSDGSGTTVRGDQPPTTPSLWSRERVENLRQVTTIR